MSIISNEHQHGSPFDREDDEDPPRVVSPTPEPGPLPTHAESHAWAHWWVNEAPEETRSSVTYVEHIAHQGARWERRRVAQERARHEAEVAALRSEVEGLRARLERAEKEERHLHRKLEGRIYVGKKLADTEAAFATERAAREKAERDLAAAWGMEECLRARLDACALAVRDPSAVVVSRHDSDARQVIRRAVKEMREVHEETRRERDTWEMRYANERVLVGDVGEQLGAAEDTVGRLTEALRTALPFVRRAGDTDDGRRAVAIVQAELRGAPTDTKGGEPTCACPFATVIDGKVSAEERATAYHVWRYLAHSLAQHLIACVGVDEVKRAHGTGDGTERNAWLDDMATKAGPYRDTKGGVAAAPEPRPWTRAPEACPDCDQHPEHHAPDCPRRPTAAGEPQPARPKAWDEDQPCARCGDLVEPARRCYAVPTCYVCLPPPEPLPIAGKPQPDPCPECGGPKGDPLNRNAYGVRCFSCGEMADARAHEAAGEPPAAEPPDDPTARRVRDALEEHAGVSVSLETADAVAAAAFAATRWDDFGSQGREGTGVFALLHPSPLTAPGCLLSGAESPDEPEPTDRTRMPWWAALEPWVQPAKGATTWAFGLSEEADPAFADGFDGVADHEAIAAAWALHDRIRATAEPAQPCPECAELEADLTATREALAQSVADNSRAIERISRAERERDAAREALAKAEERLAEVRDGVVKVLNSISDRFVIADAVREVGEALWVDLRAALRPALADTPTPAQPAPEET